MKETKEQRIQILADQLQSFLMITDSFMENLTDEDYDLLSKTKHPIQANINIKQSAAPLMTAFGIEHDTTEEKYRLKTVLAIENLLMVRKEYKKALIKKNKDDLEQQKNKQQLMQLFGIID